jgi:pyruvate,orthophosphate dikinase
LDKPRKGVAALLPLELLHRTWQSPRDKQGRSGMTKWVYGFGGGKADGSSRMKDLLGGKGANLAEMASLGLPVPPGFTVTTEVCSYFYKNGKTYPAELKAQVEAGLDEIGRLTGRTFGDTSNPLLVSVRSGARASMPGMMDTVLNLGLNDATAKAIAAQTGNERFAFDSYRRFITMYSDVVLGVSHDHFEEILGSYKEEHGLSLDTDVDAAGWMQLVERYKACVQDELGEPFPQDPQVQLWGAIGAVFGSWQNARANTYRRLHSIPDDWGTAVTIQAMVFGNMGEDSATGVAFSRNPSTGDSALYGEYLLNAQGEDVVAGLRTPQSLTSRERLAGGSKEPSLEETMPKVFSEFQDYVGRLESHYRDMQDIEFTIEKGRLWVLQTRNGKRTAKAALKIAVDLANQGVITRQEAVKRVEPSSLDQLLHPTLDPKAERVVLASGLPASPGAASGEIVFDASEAERLAGEGRDIILVRIETSPEDIHGMHAARGILTARGGMTSHAAVVARGMGRPCVSGAGGLKIDYSKQQLTALGQVVKKGEVITLDGSTGQVMMGRVATINPELSGDFGTLMGWADGFRRMQVRANAETPMDARHARDFGAEGIGLCRTEHMFFDETRINVVRQMILSDTKAGREVALAKLLPFQRGDFVELFRIMAGLPVTIRLLDPPLHEFLPKEDEVSAVSAATGIEAQKLASRLDELEEENPMLGHRGCRLGISFPEIYDMQARAIFEAAVEVEKETGKKLTAEIMIPLVAMRGEFDFLKQRIDAVAKAVEGETGRKLAYLVGTMIELPRAALRAGDIAKSAEFFSFGTNDLTQTTFGLSRDDSSKFLPDYVSRGILPNDPFVTLDTEGVGELIRIAEERGRKARPGLKLGICGEHGGDPASIWFCEATKLDYVSCSPYRVPIARLAAAQAALG